MRQFCEELSVSDVTSGGVFAFFWLMLPRPG